MTRKRRLIFRPIEQLHVSTHNSNKVEKVKMEDYLDHEFKPGLYQQTQAFLTAETQRFCSLANQVEHARIYSLMAGYDKRTNCI